MVSQRIISVLLLSLINSAMSLNLNPLYLAGLAGDDNASPPSQLGPTPGTGIVPSGPSVLQSIHETLQKEAPLQRSGSPSPQNPNSTRPNLHEDHAISTTENPLTIPALNESSGIEATSPSQAVLNSESRAYSLLLPVMPLVTVPVVLVSAVTILLSFVLSALSKTIAYLSSTLNLGSSPASRTTLEIEISKLDDGIRQIMEPPSIASAANAAFDYIGIKEVKCQYKLLCESSKSVSESYPEAIASMVKASSGLMFSGFSNNEYFASWLDGLVAKNCSKFTTDGCPDSTETRFNYADVLNKLGMFSPFKSLI